MLQAVMDIAIDHIVGKREQRVIDEISGKTFPEAGISGPGFGGRE